MDWIERWFNIVPDNGDGSMELLCVIALGIAVFAIVMFSRAAWRKSTHRASVALDAAGAPARRSIDPANEVVTCPATSR